MSKVTTNYMKHYKWTSKTLLSELAGYTEEFGKNLKDQGEEGRDTVDKIAQEIVDNDYSSEKIKQISYDLGTSAFNAVAGMTKIPYITTKLNKIQAEWLILDEDEGVDWPPYFYLEPVQKRLEKCDISILPSKENLLDIMIIIRRDMGGLKRDLWYSPKYSWYCTGYSKTKKETGIEEPQLFLLMEKNLLQAKELLTWIQKAISEKFYFLQKNKSDIVNVNPINLILVKHEITSNKLRKIGTDHTSRIHEDFAFQPSSPVLEYEKDKKIPNPNQGSSSVSAYFYQIKIYAICVGKDLDDIDVRIKFIAGLSLDNKKRVDEFGIKKPLKELVRYLIRDPTFSTEIRKYKIEEILPTNQDKVKLWGLEPSLDELHSSDSTWDREGHQNIRRTEKLACKESTNSSFENMESDSSSSSETSDASDSNAKLQRTADYKRQLKA
ncbi:hypothetical protein C1645_829276 [Glomus cerebriforme]|uniref:Uncharacterized protein n=1 Tax=Glomus cerebriforme TaxID=658196 RepID=A0A397SQZ7_9GLOM|nr:hypothetical protein C1645_829276 [Glomus cerebriforme]